MSIAEVEAQRENVSGVDAQSAFPNGWTKIDNDLQFLPVSVSARFLFVTLRMHANSEGRCWPSLPTLAGWMGASKSTVARALKELEKLGVVRKSRRVSAKGGLTSNEYWVAVSLRPYVQNEPTLGSNRVGNKTQLTKPLQDSISCPYVRNAREAETTEKISEPRIGEEASAPSGAGSPLRGGREEVSGGEVSVPAEPSASDGGAWGDDVPLPAPRHVYGQGSDASEDHAKAPVGGVQGSPVPSPTPDVPKRPRKPSLGWMRDAPKRWADDGKLTTIPPTFVPSPRHVAFAEAWGLDVESIGKCFVAKHLAAGTLVQLWDWHFAELLEMKRLDKVKAEREAEALKPELEAAEAARQARRREWSERLESQKAGAVPPTPEFLALRPKMEALRAKYGMKPKPKGEPYGWRTNHNVGGESHGGPGTAIREQRDPGVFVHPGLDPAPSEPGDPDVGGRGDDVRPLRRVEADGGERRRIVGEGEPGGGDRTAVGTELRARGAAADVDQPGGGRDRPVPEIRDGDADEDELGPVDVAAEFYAWRRIRDAQLAG